MYKVNRMMSNQPQDDLMEEEFEWKNNWAKSNESNLVGEFSAICLLTARYMADVLGKDKVHISKAKTKMSCSERTLVIQNSVVSLQVDWI